MKKKILKKKSKFLVITSINKPNNVINKYIKLCKEQDVEFVFVSDKKTPLFKNKNLKLLDLSIQQKLPFKFSKTIPYNCYSRKNIGYLYSMHSGAEMIYETDDDNYPKFNFFNQKINKLKIFKINDKGYINIYNFFTQLKDNIWPRGYPLSKIINQKKKNLIFKKSKRHNFPIVQRLCDGNPDVDAIYRLINKNIDIKFKKNLGYYANNKSYIPFNSQNTIWDKSVFPLMYLPTYCTMRATDIWRSYIANYILNKLNMKILFTSPTVFQKRNFHNLLNDFEDEVPVYRDTEKIIEILETLKLYKSKKKLLKNLLICYEKLIENNFFHKKEMKLIKMWCSDVNKIDKHFII